MKYLNNKANNINIDLYNGFAFATDEAENENYFQVCLSVRKDGQDYKKEIAYDDCGWNDGLCGDHNESVNSCTENHLKEFLTLARKCGVRVI